MSGLTRSRLTRRGALVGLEPDTSKAGVVAFQYNPDEMTVTVNVISTADPVTEVTTRQTNGLTVDGILTDDEHFASLAGLADFIEMVPL
jgi:hypothetical protein